MATMSTWRRRFSGWLALVVAATMLAACGGGDHPSPTVGSTTVVAATEAPDVQALGVAAVADDPRVTALTKLSETRVGRTTFDYVFRITVTNGAKAQPGLVARISAAGAGTTVIDGNVVVGNLVAGATVSPDDTIRLRHDRSLPFQPSLLAWAFTTSGPVPASMALDLPQRVIGAGTPLALEPTVLDAGGQLITPPPAIDYAVIVPATGAKGTLPTVTGGKVVTAADTRGNYSVRGTVAGTAITASVGFTALQSSAVSANAAQYTNLSAAQSTFTRQLQLAADAAARGDAAALAAASAAIGIASNSVNVNRMGASTAYAPDSGFFPTPAKLIANGITAGAGDAGFGTATTQLRAKLAQITSLLSHPSGNDASDGALLSQYQADLEAISATLKSAAAKPTLFGVVKQADQVSDLLAKDMPALLKASATRAQAVIATGNLTLDRKFALSVAAGEGRATPAGLVSGSLNALGPIGKLVNALYGDYLDQIVNAAILLGTKSLLDAFLAQSIAINGVLSGAALLGPYAYNYADSYIDLNGLTVAEAQGADVYMIGGAAINALGGAVSAVTNVPKNPGNIDELHSYFKGVMDAIDSVGEAYDLAHQQPAFVITNSFSENFGCLPSLNDFCIEMHYPAGFKNVSGGNVSFTVLMLIRTSGPRPQYGARLFNFAPGT